VQIGGVAVGFEGVEDVVQPIGGHRNRSQSVSRLQWVSPHSTGPFPSVS
jgi:hypothetical protein